MNLTLSSSSTKGQTPFFSQEKLLGSRYKGYTSQTEKAWPFVCIKAHWYTSDILPYVNMFNTKFYYQLCAIGLLVIYLYKRTAGIFKTLLRVE